MPRGRPPFKPTPVQRRKVAAATAGGMSQDAIAIALGIDTKTLVKHFGVELTTGASVKRMEAMDALYAAAKRGNVSACKAVLALEAAKPPRMPDGDGDAPQPEAAPPAPIRLGKKERAQLQAESAQQGTAWEEVLRPPGAPVQ